MGMRGTRTDAPTPSWGEPVREASPARKAMLWGMVGVGVVWWVGGVATTIGGTDWIGVAWWLLTSANVVGAIVVVARRPAHPSVGWFAAIPVLYAASDAVAAVIIAAADSGVTVLVALAGFARAEIGIIVSVALARVVGLFATGKADRRWELPALRSAWALVAVPIVVLLTTPAIPASWWESQGVGIPNLFFLGLVAIDPVIAASVQDNVGALALLLALVVLVLRYRTAPPDVRRTMRWLLIPIAISLPVVVAGAIAVGVDGGADSGVAFLVTGLIANATYVTVIVFGILWPHGAASPRTLRRSVVYGVLWGLISAAFVIAGVMVGVAASTVMPIAGAIALAVVVAVAVQPLRRRLEAVADRWLFGARPDPRQLVVRLGETLAQSDDLDALLPRIGTALQEGFDLEWARVRLTPVAEAEEDAAEVLTVPIDVDGERVGVIECGPKRSGELRGDDIELIGTFAGQAGIAVRNVLLTGQLADRAAELRESRTRLVRSQEAERRRIERNIHDGVQQDLTALIGIAAHARAAEEHRSADLDDDLDVLTEGLQRVLADIRTLAQGIHPSVLSDRGLVAAVEALAARHPIPITVHADDEVKGMRLSDELEGAAYFTVAESLANSLKHAGASHVDVEVSISDGVLALRTSDDGVGFDPVRATGNGLSNLSARVAAVGGRLDVSATAGGGATVAAEFALAGGET